MKYYFTLLAIAILFTNVAILSAQNVGVGTDTPAEFFSIGANSQYRVNANGNLVRINDVQYNFPATQATSGSVLANDGSGNLSWTKVTTGNISATGTANSTTFLRGDGAWAAPAGGGSSAGIVSSTSVSVTPPGTTTLQTGTQVFTHTVATTGTYMISGFISMSASVSSVVHIRVNGVLYQSSGLGGALDNFNTAAVGCVVFLNAGDIITANVQTYNATAVTGRIDLAKL